MDLRTRQCGRAFEKLAIRESQDRQNLLPGDGAIQSQELINPKGDWIGNQTQHIQRRVAWLLLKLANGPVYSSTRFR